MTATPTSSAVSDYVEGHEFTRLIAGERGAASKQKVVHTRVPDAAQAMARLTR